MLLTAADALPPETMPLTLTGVNEVLATMLELTVGWTPLCCR